jgi:hypothetical protein
MISKGTTHNNGARLAAYMTTGKDGERAELWQLRGFEATNIKDAFRDVQIIAGATKAEQPFFHVQVRNRERETLSRQQFEYAADRIERMLGLAGQPRAIAFHINERTGAEHMHVAWSRIDENTLTAIPLPFFKERLKKISRELELHFGLEPVTNRRKGNIRFAPTRAEQEQAKRIGLDVHEVRNAIRDCWDRSDCGMSFQAALDHEGLILAKGEKRDYVVIDRAGGMTALGKRILDVSAAETRRRLSDLPRDELPTVQMAQEFVKEQQQVKQQEKAAPVWDRDRDDRAWQDAVINAAIDKEKAERQFVEPKEREGRGREEKEKSHRAERPLDPTAANIRLAWSLSHSPDGFVKNLDECGFRVACVTKEEAARSHRDASFAREAGRFAPEFREGEYVVINENGRVYSLNSKTTGRSRDDVADFMRTVDDTKIEGIEATRQRIAGYKRPAPARELWQNDTRTPSQIFGAAEKEAVRRDGAPDPMRGPGADIFTAWQRSDNARAFVKALEERNITVAAVTREDATNSEIDRFYATDRTSRTPKLREGDYVAIADNGRIYNFNSHTTGEKADRVQKFMATLDRKEFQSVHAVLGAVKERAAARDIERQAFRDLSAGEVKREKDARPTGRLGRTARSSAGKIRSAAAAGMSAARVAGKTLDAVSDAFASLFSPTLTPQQIREGENAARQREGEAEASIDFSRYTAEMAQQRRREEQEILAARHRQREERGRER